jgi:membrane protein implicated in regulation of membrane protease activity
LHERATALKESTPLILAAALFLVTAFLLFTAALVLLVSSAFAAEPYRWFFSLAIIGVLWSICGSVAFVLARRRVKMQPMLPVRTLQILSEDKSRLEQMEGVSHEPHEHGESGTKRNRAA